MLQDFYHLIYFGIKGRRSSKKQELEKKGAISPAEASELATKHSCAHLELVQSCFTLIDFKKP